MSAATWINVFFWWPVTEKFHRGCNYKVVYVCLKYYSDCAHREWKSFLFFNYAQCTSTQYPGKNLPRTQASLPSASGWYFVNSSFIFGSANLLSQISSAIRWESYFFAIWSRVSQTRAPRCEWVVLFKMRLYSSDFLHSPSHWCHASWRICNFSLPCGRLCFGQCFHMEKETLSMRCITWFILMWFNYYIYLFIYNIINIYNKKG